MSTLAAHLDPDICASGKDWPFAYPNIAFIELRNIVQAIDLVDAIQAIFLNHRYGAAGTLFRRLH